MQVPFTYFMGRKIDDEEDDISDDGKENENDNQSNMIILRKSMKDFIGLENVSDEIK